MTTATASESVLLSSLVLDYNLYPRKDVYWQNVGSLVEAVKAGATLPPIIADRASNRVVDGFHRYQCYEKTYGGNNVEVEVEFRDYASEGELFLDAIRLNSGHGQRLSTFDIARSTQRAEELGLTRDVVAGAAGWTRERLDATLLTRTTISGEMLKRTNSHLAGTELSKKQSQYNQYAGGMSQAWYIKQVIALAESASLDFEDEVVVEQLRLLAQVCEAVIAPHLETLTA